MSAPYRWEGAGAHMGAGTRDCHTAIRREADGTWGLEVMYLLPGGAVDEWHSYVDPIDARTAGIALILAGHIVAGADALARGEA